MSGTCEIVDIGLVPEQAEKARQGEGIIANVLVASGL